MKINKIFFLPLTVSFSLYGLYQAGPDRQSIDWRLAFQQGLNLEREFTALKTADQTSIIPCPVIQSMSCIGDFKRYISTADTTNKNDSTPLHDAARNGNTDLVQLLLDNGADVNAQYQNANTPLHRASSVGNAAMIQLLLDNGARINVVNEQGDTPLHLAIWNCRTTMIQLLLDNGADINARSLDGDTPLHLAAQVGSSDFIQFLLNNGADVNAANKQSSTPLHQAIEKIISP